MFNKGKNLIFIISQPRAGSTLTQRILGSHSLIHTQSEPWILLHPLHALKPDNNISVYDSDLSTKAINDFIDSLPGGKLLYKETIAEAYESFYEAILKQKEKIFFLDKTPRYYFIIKELYDFFPDAKFIFLWRNPASVITSIINTWTKDNWFRLSYYKDDILRAPLLMLEGRKNIGSISLSICYEDLITKPLETFEIICKFVGIPFEENMINYGEIENKKWLFGDNETIYEKSSPDSSNTDKWQSSLNNPQVWRIVSDYINCLGEQTISEMGYSYKQIINVLQEKKPVENINKHSIALNQLLENTHFIFFENRRLLDVINQKNIQLKQLYEIQKQNDEQTKRKDEELKSKDEELKQKEIALNSLIKSFSFKLGNIILWPIKSMFKKRLAKKFASKKKINHFLRNIIIFCLPILFYILLIVISDPYNYFNAVKLINDSAKRKSFNRSAKTMVIGNMLYKTHEFKRNPCSNIILGDSRANNLDQNYIQELSGKKYYNLGIPGGNYKSIMQLFWFANSNIKLKNVYIIISFHNYIKDWGKYLYDESKMYDKKIYPYFINKTLVNQAFYNIGILLQNKVQKKTENNNNNKNKRYYLNSLDTLDKKYIESWNQKVEQQKEYFVKWYKHPDDFKDSIYKISEYCNKNNINLNFIIVPNHIDFHKLVNEVGLEAEMQRFKNDFCQVGEVFDFDYKNEITTNKKNYRDIFHVNDSISDLICKEVWGVTEPKIAKHYKNNILQKNINQISIL